MVVPWYCHQHMIIHERHQGLVFLFPAPASAPFLSPVPESSPLTPMTSQESYPDTPHSSPDIPDPPEMDAVIDEAIHLVSDDNSDTSTGFKQRVWRSPTPATAPFILSSQAVNGLPVAVPPRQGSPLTTESGLASAWDVNYDPLQSDDQYRC